MNSRTEFYIVITVMLMLIVLFISYIFQTYDLIWLYNNGYDIEDIANKNTIFNRTQMFNYLNNELVKYNNKYKSTKIVLDNKYLPLKIKEMKIFLSKDFTDLLKYKKDIRDCDDFSMIMYANIHRTQSRYYDVNLALGIISGDEKLDSDYSHMINFFIEDKENKLICFEPQSDKMAKCEDFFVRINFFII